MADYDKKPEVDDHGSPADQHADHDGHDDHDHGEVSESIKRGTVVVGFRTELTDVARWLPDIAAKTDMPESDWNTVNDASQKIKAIIESVAENATDAEFRSAWQKQQTDITKLLNKLRQIAGEAGVDVR